MPYELTPDAKIALAMRDAGVRQELFGYVFTTLVGNGYRSRPEDASVALQRMREKEMPQAFEEDNAPPLSDFQRFQRSKGAV